MKQILSEIVFRLKRRPRVDSTTKQTTCGDTKRSPFKHGASGAMVISTDFELAWGWRFAKTNIDFITLARRERDNISLLLEIFDMYKIPVTWATVGHLFLERCERAPNGLPHPNMPRPPHFVNKWWKFESGDWYQHDPCTDFLRSPEWYAPDLVKKILKAKVKHEIALHSFSHIPFTRDICSKELAEAEIKESIELMRTFGIVPKSMIYPGGFKDYVEILHKFGIIAFRGDHRRRDVEMSYPFKVKGIWNIPATIGLSARKSWKTSYYVERIKRYIRRAITHGVVFHMWFHPSIESSILRNVLPAILEYADKQRQQGRLWIATMQEIAIYCEARKLC